MSDDPPIFCGSLPFISISRGSGVHQPIPIRSGPLPHVNRFRKDAFVIDITPYKNAIDNHISSDMIMTAHIQYLALNNTKIYSQYDEKMTLPAIMSLEIQTNILRNVLVYRGVTISDPLNMEAIADHFTQPEAVEGIFSQG